MGRNLFAEPTSDQGGVGRNLFATSPPPGGNVTPPPELDKPEARAIVPELLKAGGKQLGAAAETAYSLGEGAIVWPISKVAGLTGILEGGEEMKEREEATAQFLTHKPVFEDAEGAMGIVGKGFEAAETPQRMAAEELERRGHGRSAYIVKFLSDLAMFKFLHAGGTKAKAKVLKESIPKDVPITKETLQHISEVVPTQKEAVTQRIQRLKEEGRPLEGLAEAERKLSTRAYSPELSARLKQLETPQLPAGQGFQMSNVPGMNLFSPDFAAKVKGLTDTRALPEGQGFQMKPRAVLRKGEQYPEEGYVAGRMRAPEVEYKDILSKSGGPYKSLKAAKAAMKSRKDLPEGYQPVQIDGGWALRKGAKGQPRRVEPVSGAGPQKGPENLVTRLQQPDIGKVRIPSDWDPKTEAQFPDVRRALSQKSGLPIDDVVSTLQREGWLVKSDDHLMELLRTGKARKTYNPEKVDSIVERKNRKLDEEYEAGYAWRELEDYVRKNPEQAPDIAKIDAEHQGFIEDLYNEGIVQRPTDKAAKGNLEAEAGREASQAARERIHGTLEKEGYPPEAFQELGKWEAAKSQESLKTHVANKYADILAHEESNITGPVYNKIDQGTLRPVALDKYLSKIPPDSKPKTIRELKSVIADRTGDLIETYLYEGAQEGTRLEGYIDSLVDVVKKHEKGSFDELSGFFEQKGKGRASEGVWTRPRQKPDEFAMKEPVTSKKGPGEIPTKETSESPKGGGQVKADEKKWADEIVYLHEVTDPIKKDRLVSSMEKDGWQGPPILVVDTGNGTFALTGSHRWVAAKKADIEVPVKHLDFERVESWAKRTGKTIDDILEGRNEDRLAALKEVGDSEAIALMEFEVGKDPFKPTQRPEVGAQERPAEPLEPFEIKDQVSVGPTVDFLGFQQIYENVRKAFKPRKKPGEKVTKEDVKRFDQGNVVKHRVWKHHRTGERLSAPPIYEVEKKIVKDLPELGQKPLGGWTENPLRTFEELGSNAKELFYRPIKEAEKRATIERQATDKWVNGVFKGVPGKSRRRIGAYAVARQKRGRQILESMGIDEVPRLTAKERKVYDTLRDKFEEYYHRLNKVRRLSGKETFPKTENYFTFLRHLSALEEMGFNPVTTKSLMIQKQFQHLKTTPFKFAKARARAGTIPVELDALKVFKTYSEPAIRHIHASPSIAKGRELLLQFPEGNGKHWLLKEEAPRTAKFLTDWLDYQAGQRPVTNIPRMVEKALFKINQNLAFAVLSANLRSAVIQPSALVQTFTELGPKWTARGIKTLLDTKARNLAFEKSNVLLPRQYDVAISDAMRGITTGKVGDIKKVVSKVGFKPLQWLDMETARATWQGAYEKALNELNYAEKKAINYADDIVTKTQASAMPSDIAPIQRTAMGKFVTMFQTFVINEWGFLTKDVLGIKNPRMKNRETMSKVGKLIVGTTLFNMLYEDLLGINSPFPTPVRAYMEAIEDGEPIPSAAVDTALELVEKVPVLGGGARYGSHPLGAGMELLGETALQLSGREKPKLRTAGKWLGIPGSGQISKTVRAKKRGETPYGQAMGVYTEDKGKKLKGLSDLKGLEGL